MDRLTGTYDAPDLTYPLAGRDREREELHAILNRCLSGHGGVVLISGEAGIGKTTLCDRLGIQALGAGARLVTGHCYHSMSGRPYGPWIEIGQALAAESADTLVRALTQASASASGAQSKDELFAQISTALREVASSGSLVLIAEDIHWADHASLELLRHIARQAASLPLLLVATFRDDEPNPESALPGALLDLVRESRAYRFELRRLSLDDVHEFVNREYEVDETARATIAGYLHERAEGNPFFMIELIRDIDQQRIRFEDLRTGDAAELRGLPVPGLVRQVIDNRVRQLSESTRKLLNSAAVIGQEVPVDLWRSVSNTSERELADAIEEAVACHLLTESGNGEHVRFVHGLIQESLYRSQVALRRREVHREVASYLAEHPSTPPDVVAHHFERANDQRAIDWLVRAAGLAQEVYAAPDAIRCVNRATELSEQFSVELPLDAYRIRALAHEMLGEIDLAKSGFASLLHAARDLGDRRAECRALIDLGLLWAGQDYQRSGDYLGQALSIARDLGNDLVHAQCLNRVANWQANTGQFEPAIKLHQEALQIFEVTNDSDGIADTLDLLGLTNYLAGNYGDSVEYYNHAIRRSRGLNDRVRLASSLAGLAINGGDFDVSFDAGVVARHAPEVWVGYGEEAIQIAREIGWKTGESFALAMLGAVVAVRGDLGRGLTALESAHEIAHRFGHQQWLTATSLIMGSIWNELLDPSRAEFHLTRGKGLARGLGSHLWSRLLDAALATFHAENGDVASGLALLKPWSNGDGAMRSHAQRALQFATGRVRLAAGEPEAALKIAGDLLALEEGHPEVEGIPQVLRLKADALGMLDQIDDADEVYASAARASEVLGYRSIHWHILRDWSRIADRRGQHRQASELRSAAEAIVRDVARTITDPEIRDRFHRRAHESISNAIHPQRQSTQDSAGLSRRELEVLVLVAEGLTDAQVGERLFISPRTVARHLQSIYTKLGVNSRAGATAFAYKHELIS